MIGLAAAVAAGTLAAGLGAVLVARRLPTLAAQLAVLTVASVLIPVAALLLTGAVMFDSAHDLTVLGIACAASLAALIGALVFSRGLSARLARLGAAASAVAAGDLGARAEPGGPREIAELSASFNSMADRLEMLFDMRRELVAWASHDLRTPVASLRAMIEALEDGVAPPERYLPAMRERVEALGGLIDDLFELARIDAGALALEVDRAAIPGIVEACMAAVEAEASTRGIRLEADLPAALPPARCSREGLTRVLDNLLRNALRHTPGDGTVAVRVGPDGDALLVAVEDTGEGFPDGGEGRAFERFWRADRARGDGGAGLGLAIARGLVEAQGGRIWAERREGGGARVCFTVPVDG